MRERSTKVKGNQLVFTESRNIYRDQVGPIHEPAADEVISNESVNIIKGNNIEKKKRKSLCFVRLHRRLIQTREDLMYIFLRAVMTLITLHMRGERKMANSCKNDKKHCFCCKMVWEENRVTSNFEYQELGVSAVKVLLLSATSDHS